MCMVITSRARSDDCSGDEATTGDLSWAKWSYWLLHSLLFLSVYTAILVLPHTRFRVSHVYNTSCHFR
jgi:Predicted membrane protein